MKSFGFQFNSFKNVIYSQRIGPGPSQAEHLSKADLFRLDWISIWLNVCGGVCFGGDGGGGGLGGGCWNQF